MAQGATLPLLPAAQALNIVEQDAINRYHDLSPYSILLKLEPDGWHIDYELRSESMTGGGPHYVVDATSGEILSKRYEQ